MCTEVRVARCSSARSSGLTVQLVHSRRSGHRRVYPALPSSWEEAFSHLFPALRGLERPGLPALRPKVRNQPLGRPARNPQAIRSPVSLRAHLPARWNRTVTLHPLPNEVLSSAAFSKDRPFVAPESSSPLPNRIAPVLRRSAATPPACSDLVVSRHFAGLLLVDPVRTVAAAHDPGVHRRFTRASKPKFRWLAPERSCEIPAMRFCPSKLSLRRWLSSLDAAEASCDARRPCGEALTSCPVVTPLCCSTCAEP